jgi:hypothetical protein
MRLCWWIALNITTVPGVVSTARCMRPPRGLRHDQNRLEHPCTGQLNGHLHALKPKLTLPKIWSNKSGCVQPLALVSIGLMYAHVVRRLTTRCEDQIATPERDAIAPKACWDRSSSHHCPAKLLPVHATCWTPLMMWEQLLPVLASSDQATLDRCTKRTVPHKTHLSHRAQIPRPSRASLRPRCR